MGGSRNNDEDNPLFEKALVRLMQDSYQQTINSNNLSHLIPHDGELLMSRMEECYRNLHHHKKCPGPHVCSVPPVNRTCIFAKGNYIIVMAKKTMKVAVLHSAHFESVVGCSN